MNARQESALALRETDVAGALLRLGGNEELYLACLRLFLEDPTLEQLAQAIRDGFWDDAFTAAHALKGLAGNMGFVPLMHSTGQLVIVIRGGRTGEIGECMLRIKSNYRDITDAIHEVLRQTETRGEEL